MDEKKQDNINECEDIFPADNITEQVLDENEIRRKINQRRLERQRRARKKRLISCGAVLALIAVVVLLIFLLSNHSIKASDIYGKWRFDEETYYVFDKDGKGELHYRDALFLFTYKVENNRAYLDFEDETVHDCEYGLKLNGKILSVEGGEGTLGGTTDMEKE